jgi:GDP-mannose 6-dehydrogenase
MSHDEALDGAEVSFVCVGTPPALDGSVDTSTVEAVCGQIGRTLSHSSSGAHHTVVIRSTVMPGTTARCGARLEAEIGRALGEGFTICINPEFLREGVAVADFLDPSYTVIGAREPKWADPLGELFSFLEAPWIVTEPEVAEMLKMVCNTWHAAKVCFANEVGRLCRANDVDAQEVMDIVTRDRRLNVSARYLRPGFAYGGSCLPKDVSAVVHLARRSQVELPLIEGLPRSNDLHIDQAKARILASGRRRVGFLGLSFKPGTDDLRGSPLVDLVEFCVGKGFAVQIYDPGVRPARLVGRNLQVALERLGHLADLLVPSLDEIAASSELLVVGHHDERFTRFCRALPREVEILDLVGALAD